MLALVALLAAADPPKPSKYQSTVIREPAGPAYFHIAFAAEGFTAGQRAAFARRAEELATVVRVQPVFSKHTKRLKFSAVWVPSADEGAGREAVWDAREKDWKLDKAARRTAFGSVYHTERQLYKLTNYHAVRAANAAAGYDADVLVVVVNRADRGGIALLPGTVAGAAYWAHKDTPRPFDYEAKKDDLPGGLVVLGGGDAAAVLVHELGHAVAGLGDEYVTTLKANRREENAEWAGRHPNVSDTPDRRTLKWRDLLGKDGVGVFEGAIDRAKGLYRPWEDGCVMGEDPGAGRFCPVCERALHRAIEAGAAAKVSGN